MCTLAPTASSFGRAATASYLLQHIVSGGERNASTRHGHALKSNAVLCAICKRKLQHTALSAAAGIIVATFVVLEMIGVPGPVDIDAVLHLKPPTS